MSHSLRLPTDDNPPFGLEFTNKSESRRKYPCLNASGRERPPLKRKEQVTQTGEDSHLKNERRPVFPRVALLVFGIADLRCDGVGWMEVALPSRYAPADAHLRLPLCRFVSNDILCSPYH